MKILLVDDTPENLVSLEARLNGLGEELVLAQIRQGSAALSAGRRFRGHSAGRENARHGRLPNRRTDPSPPRSRHTPILFLTGYRNEEHLFRGYDLGAVDFLFKPIVPEVLRSKVGVFVELSRNNAAAAAPGRGAAQGRAEVPVVAGSRAGRDDHQFRGRANHPGQFPGRGAVRLPARGADRAKTSAMLVPDWSSTRPAPSDGADIWHWPHGTVGAAQERPTVPGRNQFEPAADRGRIAGHFRDPRHHASASGAPRSIRELNATLEQRVAERTRNCCDPTKRCGNPTTI